MYTLTVKNLSGDEQRQITARGSDIEEQYPNVDLIVGQAVKEWEMYIVEPAF
jgi:hypothetical protein